jgi:ribonuclease P protein component
LKEPDGMAGEPRTRCRFGRAMRLKQGRDFLRIRQHGRRLPCGCFIANWQVLPDGSATRLGVITSKAIGNAVVRARARRLLREAFRRHQHDLARPVDLVLVAQRSLPAMEFAAVEQAYKNMLAKTGLLRTQ